MVLVLAAFPLILTCHEKVIAPELTVVNDRVLAPRLPVPLERGDQRWAGKAVYIIHTDICSGPRANIYGSFK